MELTQEALQPIQDGEVVMTFEEWWEQIEAYGLGMPEGYYIVKGTDITIAYQSNFFVSDLLDIVEQSPTECIYKE